MQYVLFSLDDGRYGIPLGDVIEVTLRVALTPVPGAPPGMAGLFSCRGVPVVAVDLRERLHHPPRPPSMSDRIVVVRGARRLLGLVVDDVHGLVEAHAVTSPVVAQGISGIVPGADGLWLVHDVERLLTDGEESALDAGLAT